MLCQECQAVVHIGHNVGTVFEHVVVTIHKVVQCLCHMDQEVQRLLHVQVLEIMAGQAVMP